MYTQEDSHVEVKGFEAKHYDFLMNLITLGTYPFFIRKAINSLPLKEGDSVIDFGAGTGRNDCLIRKRIGDSGKIVALDIGEEMMENFRKNCKKYKNVHLVEQRIEEDFDLGERFDLAFISFVLHGFTQENRDKIIKNVVKHLKDGGYFCILDYNEIDLDRASFIAKMLFKLECPLATDFINRKWKSILKEYGFSSFTSKLFYGGLIRLLCAKL